MMLSRQVRVLCLVLCSAGAVVACGGATTGGTTVADLPPADPAAVREYNAAIRLARRGGARNLQRAQRRLTKALEIDPNLWEARYDLGVLQRRTGNLEGARASFEAAHAIQPAAEEPLLAAAEAAYALGDASGAADRLGSLVEAHPENIDARIALAVIQREAGDYDDALAQAREVLVRDPTQVRALLEIARVYRVRERPDVAQLVLQKALALVDASAGEAEGDEAARLTRLRAELLDERGLLELSRGDTQAAFQAFEEAIAAQADFTSARMNMGSVLLHAGDFVGSAAQYEAVLAQDDEDLDARVGLAISLRGQGEHRRAERAYRAVIAVDENHADALFNLAVLMAEFLDQRTQSRAMFQRYLQAAPRRHPAREAATRYLEDIPAPGPTTP